MHKQNSLSPHLLIALFILITVGISVVATQQAVPANAAAPHNNSAQATEKIIVALANETTTWADATFYTINPQDGSDKTPLFDFHSQSKLTTGELYAPRMSADGKYIYFHSQHAYIYTPARRNLFRIATQANTLDQITPGPNSGMWGQTGNSTVSGTVRHGNGTPWSNSPVYLEGMDMVYSGADGTFSFHNVPAGVRWLVAYRPALDAFEAQSINVIPNLNTTGLVLQPNNNVRMNFEDPALFNDRIYYRFTNEIQWTDVNFAPPQTVYTSPPDSCVGLPAVDAFDVGSVSGKIAVYDYQTGCGMGNNNHNGIYILDKDGNNKQLFVDMMADYNWDDPILPVQVFWSPTETRLAVKASYGGVDHLLVYDSSGVLTGFAYADTSSELLTLHGWSPDGNWLLFSQYDGDPAQAALGKVRVTASGGLDNNSITMLLTNQPIQGATWGNLPVTFKVHLPIMIK